MGDNNSFGSAPQDVIICPKCIEGDPSYGIPIVPSPKEIEKVSSWCSMAHCPRCGFRWFVCRQCTSIRAILDTRARFVQHSYRYHAKSDRTTTTMKKRKRMKKAERKVDSPILMDHTNSEEGSSSSDGYLLSRRNILRDKGTVVNVPDHKRVIDYDETEPNSGYAEFDDNNQAKVEAIGETPSRRYGGVPTAVKDCKFMREQSTDYYSENFHYQRGLAYLVGRSFFQDGRPSEQVSVEDQHVCVEFGRLVKTLSQSQSDMLGDILEHLFNRIADAEKKHETHRVHMDEFVKRCYFCPNCQCVQCTNLSSQKQMRPPKFLATVYPPIPKNALEIRGKVRTGKFAFLQQLPYPEIHDLNDGHVYVLPSECIRHYLANGYTPMSFDYLSPLFPASSLNETVRGSSICQKLSAALDGRRPNVPHFYISYLEWKDDCESAKSNRQSKFGLWVYTITIIDNSRRDSPRATYPVALGPKGKSHDAVEKIIGEDMQQMRSKSQSAIFGWLGEQKPYQCTFSAELFMSLGDQPERRGANCLQLGGSRHHARWRYLCDWDQLKDLLPPCNECFQLMLECDLKSSRDNQDFDKSKWKKRQCGACCNWALDLSNKAMRFKPSPKFPKGFLLAGEEGTGPLSPIELTYSMLESVMDLTFERVADNSWSKVVGITYLTDHCINEKFAKSLVSNAWNVWLYTLARDDPSRKEHFRQLVADKRKNPAKYQRVPSPSLFQRGYPLEIFVDTPMHLIFLGFCKTVFRRISTWSARNGRKKEFLHLARKQLQQLDDLKLSWLTFVPRTFGEKWGGWVSKNYSSLARVSLWIFGPLLTIDNAAPYQDPSRAKEEWKLNDLQAWLKARGLCSKGKKEDLKKRVFDLLLGPPGEIPPILPPLYGTAEDMIEMVKSMLVLVTMIFQDSVQKHTREILELRIRVFLSRFEKFDKPMQQKGAKPTWLRSYNFICLLNLPETIHKFGPPRRWYEGKWLGERYVGTVKDERKRCPPHNLHKILMRNLHRTKALDDITRHVSSKGLADMTSLNAKIFGSTIEIESAFHSRYPLSVVLLDDGSTGCLYYEHGRNIGKVISVLLLEKKDVDGVERIQDGLVYWDYQLTLIRRPMTGINIFDYGVLLAQLGNERPGLYTIVTKNWSTVMFGEYNFKEESANYTESIEPVQGVKQDLEQDYGYI